MPNRATIKQSLLEITSHLYHHHLTKVLAQSRVSQEEKLAVALLGEALFTVISAELPTEDLERHHISLRNLQTLLLDAETPNVHDIQAELWDTCAALSPAPTPTDIAPAASPETAEPAAAPTPINHPANQRMLDALRDYQRALNPTRIRLMRAGDAPDTRSYTAARNAYTLARAAYEPRLRSPEKVAATEQNKELEDRRKELADVTGATLPEHLNATADLVRGFLFNSENPPV